MADAFLDIAGKILKGLEDNKGDDDGESGQTFWRDDGESGQTFWRAFSEAAGAYVSL